MGHSSMKLLLLLLDKMNPHLDTDNFDFDMNNPGSDFDKNNLDFGCNSVWSYPNNFPCQTYHKYLQSTLKKR